MASANLLSAELECSVCLGVYTDPVNLTCGHNFCRVCIDRVLDTQGGSGGYSCPECRQKFPDRPALQRNITLRNIVETFQSAQPGQEDSGVCCTYCLHAPVPAVKSCLHCEASLCDNHLRVHSKSPEHVLCDPTTTLKNRKCSVHKKILEYYCTQDSACICVSCCLMGEHKGHEMVSLDEASEKKKKELGNVLEKLMLEREKTEKRVQSLKEHHRNVQEEAADEAKRVSDLFLELRRRLEELEKRVLGEISGRAETVSLSVNDLIRQFEIKKDELSRNMGDIEKLYNMADPLTVLQEWDRGDLCDTEDRDDEETDRQYKLLHDWGDLDVVGISHTFHTGLSDIIRWVNGGIYIPEPADILLDVNTAGNIVQISDDRKSVSISGNLQSRPETPERFQGPQVISSQSFSSGRHYWEVDIGRSRSWIVGVCYPSMERKGKQSEIGNNSKSWIIQSRRGLFSFLRKSICKVFLGSNEIPLPADISSNRVRIYVDYEAGRISFYDLCHPIRHLHTFTTTFTEPLHAVFSVNSGCIKISEGRGDHRM